MWSAMLALAAASAGSLSECEPLPGWEDVAARSRGGYLVLGENHGSREAPAATGELVCILARDGPVLLAIEFAASSNGAWQTAWAAPHAQFRQRLLDLVPAWGSRKDGVASVAMLAMVEGLHALKEAGAPIDIVAFNGASDDAQIAAFAELPGQQPHEAMQAANIRKAAQRREYAHVVVLVGSLHASKARTRVRGIEIRPMAMLLAAPERVVALGMNTQGGTSWSCRLDEDAQLVPGAPITDDMIECGSHRQAADLPPLAPGFHFAASRRDGRYDGVFAVGPVTASPPPVIE